MSGSQSSSAAQPVSSGNWIVQSINGMQYDVLLPANYNAAIKYPTVLYLHQLDMGNDPGDLLNEVNPWFNTVAFRTAHPSIIVMPLLDQSADPSGETINWGGIGTSDSAGEDNALAALKTVMSTYSTDPSRIYVTGNSMGGIGTEDMIIKYNAYTGTEGKIFAAGLSLAGADYGQGYPQPNQSVVSALKTVPFWAIHGTQDTQVPLDWDRNLSAAEKAIGGDMKYTEDPSLGHDVWDTYYPQTGASSPLGWLFSQSTGGTTPVPTPTPVTPSANDTVVKAGSSAMITDASGNKWSITGGGQVAVNGVADTTTANVIELAYVNGTIWQENASKLWWGETAPDGSWSVGGGTATSPLPTAPTPVPPTPVPPTPVPPTPVPPTPTPTPVKPSPNDTVVKAGSTAAIVDVNANKWTITAGGQVAVNGVADTTTANVIELAYVNGTIWQENASKLWWGETKPDGSWSAGGGTATSPLPVSPTPTPVPPTPTPPPVTPSPNDSVVKAGSTAAIIDASLNKWTITSGGQVAVNGVADTTTANVIELAYVNGMIWQENASKLWWGEAKPNASWSPAAGTAASPLPVTPPPVKPSPNDTVVTAGSTAAIIDASINKWTITSGGQVAVNGVADTTTANVIELAYVNGMIWQENASKLWWGEAKPDASWSPGAGTATSPLPIAPPTPTPVPPVAVSANDTVVYAGTTNAITDANANKWTITAGGQVAVNGVVDQASANVVEIAFVNKTIWQENAGKLWWGKTSPTAGWSPDAGTGTSPLPAPTIIAASQASVTVSQSQVSVLATAGNHMVFISGNGDTVNLSGGTSTITDTGRGNTYVIPAAGKGYDSFTGNVLNLGDTLDLRTALAATNWNGATATLSKYLMVADSAPGAILSIAPTSGGAPVAIATIGGATNASLTTLLAHALT